MTISTKLILKLPVDQKGQKVLFAEASKEFVDFLFYLQSLPIGTVIRLLTKHGRVGCLGNLYTSVENLSQVYIQPNQDRESLLNPKVSLSVSADQDFPLLLSGDDDEHESVLQQDQFYICPDESHCINVANDTRAVCPEYRNLMDVEVQFVEYSSGGFVKGVVTYMIIDDLVVAPMSTISSITLLKKFNIQDFGVREGRMVDVTLTEGLKLLQASLQCQKVLTTVFFW